METIEVWRGQSTTDTDGNPIQGKPVRVGTFQAMVAPTSTTDQTEENTRSTSAVASRQASKPPT